MIVYVTKAAHPSLPLTREVASPKGEDGGREKVGYIALFKQIACFSVFSPPVMPFGMTVACEQPGRGSDSPPDCHSLPQLRFAYPRQRGP